MSSEEIHKSQFHPEVQARSLAHKGRSKNSCASDDRTRTPRLACDCTIDPDVLAEQWVGRARMARARLEGRRMVVSTGRDEAGNKVFYIETDPAKLLDDIDREALRKAGDG